MTIFLTSYITGLVIAMVIAWGLSTVMRNPMIKMLVPFRMKAALILGAVVLWPVPVAVLAAINTRSFIRGLKREKNSVRSF